MALFQCAGDNLSQVQYLNPIVSLFFFQSVFEHRHAIRAADANRFWIFFQGFLDTLRVYAFADAFFHPHPSPAGAAAKRPLVVEDNAIRFCCSV